MDQLLDLVRRVRNNLVHGSKFNDEIHSGPGFPDMLLRGSLALLDRPPEFSPSIGKLMRRRPSNLVHDLTARFGVGV